MTDPSSAEQVRTNPIEDANAALAERGHDRVVGFGDGGVMVRVDAAEAVRMSHTVIQTDVPGFGWAVAAGTTGLEVQPLDYRNELAELDGDPYVNHHRSVRTVRSFLSEIRRRPLDPVASTLSACERTSCVTAVYDDHEGGPFPRRAGRRMDRLVLELQTDPDLQAWLDIDGKWFDQEEFSNVIEERLHTIVSPDGSELPDQAALLAMIQNLRITSSGHAESDINRANGSQIIELHMENKVTTSGRLEVPEVISFRVPVHEGAAVKYQFGAWFRVKLARGQVLVCAKVRPHRQILLAAWQHVLDDIAAGLPDKVVDSDATTEQRVPVYSILDV